MKTALLLLASLLTACASLESPEAPEVSALSGAPLLPYEPPPPAEPYILAEHSEDAAFPEILEGDAKLFAGWSPDTIPAVKALRHTDCSEANVSAAVEIVRAAGQEIALEFVDVLPERGTEGVIRLRLEAPADGKAGNGAWFTIGKRVVSGDILVKRCDVDVISHELFHTVGFGHSSDPTHLLYHQVGGTIVSPGEKAQLASR